MVLQATATHHEVQHVEDDPSLEMTVHGAANHTTALRRAEVHCRCWGRTLPRVQNGYVRSHPGIYSSEMLEEG